MRAVNVPTSIQPVGHFHRQPDAFGFALPGLSATVFNYFLKIPIALPPGMRAASSECGAVKNNKSWHSPATPDGIEDMNHDVDR